MMPGSENGDDRKQETILVIEDDKSLRDGLVMNLRLEGYEVFFAEDGEQGMQMAFDVDADLILLDIMMPGWSGLDILDELRKRGEKVPVLILSARGKTTDKIEGLKLGADDYLAKPFDLQELLARVEVMLRRRREDTPEAPLSFGALTIDPACRTVRVDGKMLEFSCKEFDLLYLMASSPGRALTREQILERVWGWDYEGTARTVDNVVAALRKKLETAGDSAKRIKTLPRAGYRFEA